MAAVLLTVIQPATPIGSVTGISSTGIQVTSPASGAKVKTGEHQSVAVTVTEGHWSDFALTIEVSVRDDNGTTMWKGKGGLSGGTATISWPVSVKPGKYTLEAKTVGMFGFVNSVCSHSLEVTE
jgi:hypothetical protein